MIDFHKQLFECNKTLIQARKKNQSGKRPKTNILLDIQFTVETPLIGFDVGDLEEPLTVLGKVDFGFDPLETTPLTGGVREEALMVLGGPQRAALGSVATAKTRLIRLGNPIPALEKEYLEMEMRRRGSPIPLQTSCGAASIWRSHNTPAFASFL